LIQRYLEEVCTVGPFAWIPRQLHLNRDADYVNYSNVVVIDNPLLAMRKSGMISNNIAAQ
jgi:hypothetical protein